MAGNILSRLGMFLLLIVKGILKAMLYLLKAVLGILKIFLLLLALIAKFVLTLVKLGLP